MMTKKNFVQSTSFCLLSWKIEETDRGKPTMIMVKNHLVYLKSIGRKNRTSTCRWNNVNIHWYRWNKVRISIDLITKVNESSTIPVIVSGGYGNPDHILSALVLANLLGFAIADALHYDRISPSQLKNELNEQGVSIRARGIWKM